MIKKDESYDAFSCSSICCVPCLPLCKLWLYPLNWILHKCLGTAVLAKELSAMPVKFSFRWIFRIVLLLIAILIGITLSVSQYYLFYYTVLPTKEQFQDIHFMPSPDNGMLQSQIIFQSSKDNIIEKQKVKLGQESYSIEILFNSVAETHHNMESGNIYLSTKLTSFLPN